MKKHIFILLFSVVFFQAQIEAQLTNPYRPGESLKYVIHFGLVDAGIAKFNLEQTTFNGVPAYHGKVVASTTGISDKIFGVRDVFESYFNPNTGLPYKFIRNIKEGKHRAYNEVLFYHSGNYVITTKSGRHDIPNGILDMVTTFYHLRKIDYDKLKYGDIIKITTFFDDEVFPFDIRYRGKEKIKTRMGSYTCLKFVPFVEPGRVFKTEDDMTIWVTDDQLMIPVRVKFDLMVGSLKCDLIDYHIP